MKKIGIVTYFKSYNYGVWLQAYATQKFFCNNGFDAQIINYTNKTENDSLKLSYREKGKIYGYITSFLKSILFGKVRYYKKGFKNHLNEYYNLSPQEYSNISEMNELYYDILVVGSDQMWNPKITSNELDPVFLLQFGNCEKRISVSTSLGSHEIECNEKRKLVDALNAFDFISVREEFAKNHLQDSVKHPIKVTVDPTFLLTRQDWKELINKNSTITSEKNKYILTYFVCGDKRSERYYNMINEYSQKLNLPVWAVQFSRASSTPCDKKILGASVADFLNLIDNAALVITDSFHGVALSVNLNSNFVAIENRQNPERVRYLLNKIDLSDRIELPYEKYKEIDYSDVNVKVDSLRKDSVEWILNNVNR